MSSPTLPVPCPSIFNSRASSRVSARTIAAAYPNGYGTATVTCPDGERVLSGAYSQQDGLPSVVVYRTKITNEGTTFEADGQNASGSTNRIFTAYAICAA